MYLEELDRSMCAADMNMQFDLAEDLIRLPTLYLQALEGQIRQRECDALNHHDRCKGAR